MFARNADRARRFGAGGTSLAAIVATALVPKCPLCVAAALSALGIGAAAAHRMAPFVRAGGVVLAVIAGLTLLFLEWRRRASMKLALSSMKGVLPCCPRRG
jgi:hypothetical protein